MNNIFYYLVIAALNENSNWNNDIFFREHKVLYSDYRGQIQLIHKFTELMKLQQRLQ